VLAAGDDRCGLLGCEPDAATELGERQRPLQDALAYPALGHLQDGRQFGNRQQRLDGRHRA
jgi:hypothetical protein